MKRCLSCFTLTLLGCSRSIGRISLPKHAPPTHHPRAMSKKGRSACQNYCTYEKIRLHLHLSNTSFSATIRLFVCLPSTQLLLRSAHCVLCYRLNSAFQLKFKLAKEDATIVTYLAIGRNKTCIHNAVSE